MRKGLLLVLLIGVESVWSQGTSLSSPVRVQHEKIRPSAQKKHIEKRLEKRAEPKDPWGYMVDYRVATDLQENQSGRSYAHALAAGFQYRLMEKLYLSAGISFNYDFYGYEVLVDGQSAEGYLGDVSLGVSGEFMPRLKWSVDNEFPTSPYSRAEGIMSITQGAVNWGFDFFDRLVFVTPGLLGYYIWNRYEKSPTILTTNKQGSLRASVVAGIRVWQGLFIRASVGAQTTRYVDGSTDAAAKNSIGFGYNWKHATASMDMSNGTYADREETHLWFIDKYRRILSARVTLSF